MKSPSQPLFARRRLHPFVAASSHPLFNFIILVPGDYLGEGLQQLAVFRPSEGNWYIRSSVGRSNLVIKCGREVRLSAFPFRLNYVMLMVFCFRAIFLSLSTISARESLASLSSAPRTALGESRCDISHLSVFCCCSRSAESALGFGAQRLGAL